ncbi:NAD-dependent epimerase/dehydratase family protein [Opitutales bacterium]|jgi:nucleoside-diphosphate-sugar epimerase|nr:NAD-dependent epimerase/dehydratase family protein [Opitutales bacterium]MDC1004771.1 NAD-dependent epimerase/dehydratase family protein [Opitutales bacterium]
MDRDTFKNTNILVVGGAGFVGSNLVLKLLELDPSQIVVVDNLLSSEASNVPADSRVTFICGSITDDSILRNLPDNLDYAFHLACYHGNQSSIANPLADHENNTLTTLKLFERLKDISSLKKVVYAAAGCAVAEKTFDEAVATTENAPVSLFHDSPYSISKLIGEMYGNYYHRAHGLPFVKARFQNVYGPREILGAGQWRGTPHTVWRNVTPTFVWKALNQESLPLDNEGLGSRDFIYVEDMARGLIHCAAKGKPTEIYNLASGRETTIAELAKIINEETNNPTPPKLFPAREWDRSGKRFGSTIKAKNEIGFEAEVDIRTGISQLVNWTKENRSLIESCIKKHDRLIQNLSK